MRLDLKIDTLVAPAKLKPVLAILLWLNKIFES